MATPFSNVFERFQQKIQDYKIDQIYLLSVDSYEKYLTGFLKSGLIKFFHCKVDLTDRDDDLRLFNSTLDEIEEEIIAHLMLIEWLTKEVNNILDMNNVLSSSDFKGYSVSQNLKEKSVHKEKTVEDTDYLMMQYYLRNMVR